MYVYDWGWGWSLKAHFPPLFASGHSYILIQIGIRDYVLGNGLIPNSFYNEREEEGLSFAQS
jgi:hypothetical protein